MRSPGACPALPELVAERGDLARHALAAVAQLLQLPLQLPPLGVGAGVLLLHLLQLPLQLLQTHHRLVQLGQEGRGGGGGGGHVKVMGDTTSLEEDEGTDTACKIRFFARWEGDTGGIKSQIKVGLKPCRRCGVNVREPNGFHLSSDHRFGGGIRIIWDGALLNASF